MYIPDNAVYTCIYQTMQCSRPDSQVWYSRQCSVIPDSQVWYTRQCSGVYQTMQYVYM